VAQNNRLDSRYFARRNDVDSCFRPAKSYGGSRSAWDYGPLGVELEGERQASMVEGESFRTRPDVGLDPLCHSSSRSLGSVWPRRRCSSDPTRADACSCHKRFRADHLEEEFEERKGRPAHEERLEGHRVWALWHSRAGATRAQGPLGDASETYLGRVVGDQLWHARPSPAKPLRESLSHSRQRRVVDAPEASVCNWSRSENRSVTR